MISGSPGVDVKMKRHDEDRKYGEEDEGVNGDRLTVGLHAPEIHMSVVSRKLEQQSRRQQHEQHHAD